LAPARARRIVGAACAAGSLRVPFRVFAFGPDGVASRRIRKSLRITDGFGIRNDEMNAVGGTEGIACEMAFRLHVASLIRFGRKLPPLHYVPTLVRFFGNLAKRTSSIKGGRNGKGLNRCIVWATQVRSGLVMRCAFLGGISAKACKGLYPTVLIRGGKVGDEEARTICAKR
jgi:hypothetical protein